MHSLFWLNKTRAIILFTLMLLTAFLIISWSSYEVARQSLNDEIVEHTLPLTSDNVYSEIQQDLLKPIFISSLMAHDTFVRDWVLVDQERDPAAMIRYLSEIDRRFDTIFSYFISDRTRRYYDPKRILETVSEQASKDRWYFQVKALPDDKLYMVDARPDPEDRTHMDIFVNHKVKDYQGNFIGATGIGISVEKIRLLIEKYERRYNRTIYFIDKTGAVVLHGNAFKRPMNIRLEPGLGPLTTAILTLPGGNYQYQEQGKKVLLNTRLIPEFDWYLMVEQRSHPMEKALLTALFKNVAVSLVVSVLFLLLLWLTIGGYQRRLENMATTDKLTGIMNRQSFEYHFHRLRRSVFYDGAPVSMALIDIDHFKQINDRYGHRTGDQALQRVSELILASLRRTDKVCRWGGDEFLVMLLGCPGAEALQRMQDLSQRVGQTEIEAKRFRVQVTVSCGVAQHRVNETLDELIDRADIALYAAKQQGRNQAIKHAD